jgi:hypothetical protein
MRIKLSTSQQLFLGLILGTLRGVFFGELVGFSFLVFAHPGSVRHGGPKYQPLWPKYWFYQPVYRPNHQAFSRVPHESQV